MAERRLDKAEHPIGGVFAPAVLLSIAVDPHQTITPSLELAAPLGSRGGSNRSGAERGDSSDNPFCCLLQNFDVQRLCIQELLQFANLLTNSSELGGGGISIEFDTLRIYCSFQAFHR